MRIISQDGNIDFPYEKTILKVSSSGDVNLITAYYTDSVNYVMANYTTKYKAKKALENLRSEYELGYSCFQFPFDSEV